MSKKFPEEKARQDVPFFSFFFANILFLSSKHALMMEEFESAQDFLIKLGLKPPMHLFEMSTFSLNYVIVILTKTMNRADKNRAHF